MRGIDFPEIDQASQRHHLARGVARLQAKDVVRTRAEGAVRLRGDLEGLPEKRQIVDIDGAEVELQRFRDRADIDASALGLDAIDIRINLRGVRAEKRKDADPIPGGKPLP